MATSRRRTASSLSRVLFGGLLIIAFFLFVLWRTENPRLQGVRLAVFDFLEPALEFVAGPTSALAGLFDDVRSLADLQSENARLKKEVALLRGYRDRVKRLDRENARLRALNRVKLPPKVSFVTAAVIGDSGGPYAQSVIVNVGREDGVKDGAPALDATGLVGRIAGAGDGASRVLLLTDPTSRTPVTVGPDRIKAILVGDESARPRLLYVFGDERAKPGDQVTTSGQGGVFPRGLLVGRVAEGGEARAPRVDLAADLRTLEFVRIYRAAREREEPSPAGLIRRPVIGDGAEKPDADGALEGPGAKPLGGDAEGGAKDKALGGGDAG